MTEEELKQIEERFLRKPSGMDIRDVQGVNLPALTQTDIARLIAEVRRLRAELASLRAEVMASPWVEEFAP